MTWLRMLAWSESLALERRASVASERGRMDVYLVPVKPDRHALYCEHVDLEPALDDPSPTRTIREKITAIYRRALREGEEARRQTGSAPRPSASRPRAPMGDVASGGGRGRAAAALAAAARVDCRAGLSGAAQRIAGVGGGAGGVCGPTSTSTACGA